MAVEKKKKTIFKKKIPVLNFSFRDFLFVILPMFQRLYSNIIDVERISPLQTARKKAN